MKLIRKYDYLIVLFVSFVYYFILCAKTYSWLFVSSDSGDWLAASIIWFTPQPYGSPLYILLGHLVNLVFPHNLPLAMTVILSVIPASITVSFTYLITKKITSNVKYALASAIVLLGAAVFLTQATILEEYAISTMFLVLALYFYIEQKKKLTILMLALGTAIHVIIGLISVIWLFYHIKELKQWWKTFWVYIVFGILPYSLIFILMYLPTPFYGDSLSWQSVNIYVGATGTIGSISWYEFLFRLPYFIAVLCISMGFALVPMFAGWKHYNSKSLQIIVITIIFSFWLYLTDMDNATWTFMTFGLPMMAILAGYGLQYLPKIHYKIIIYGALVLVLVNSLFLNANLLTKYYPLATNFEKAEKELPDGSGVITFSGGAYGLGTMYVYAQGKNIVPLFLYGNEPSSDYTKNTRYLANVEWTNKTFDIQGNNTLEQVEWMLNNGRDVYILIPIINPYWENTFKYEKINDIIGRITSVDKSHKTEN